MDRHVFRLPLGKLPALLPACETALPRAGRSASRGRALSSLPARRRAETRAVAEPSLVQRSHPERRARLVTLPGTSSGSIGPRAIFNPDTGFCLDRDHACLWPAEPTCPLATVSPTSNSSPGAASVGTPGVSTKALRQRVARLRVAQRLSGGDRHRHDLQRAVEVVRHRCRSRVRSAESASTMPDQYTTGFSVTRRNGIQHPRVAVAVPARRLPPPAAAKTPATAGPRSAMCARVSALLRNW